MRVPTCTRSRWCSTSCSWAAPRSRPTPTSRPRSRASRPTCRPSRPCDPTCPPASTRRSGALAHAGSRPWTPSARVPRELAPYRGQGSDGASVDATRPVMVPRRPETPAAQQPPPPSRPHRPGGPARRAAPRSGCWGPSCSSRSGSGSATWGSRPSTASRPRPRPPPRPSPRPRSRSPRSARSTHHRATGASTADVGNITDGDPATTWSTESYVTADLGGKGGVGLQFRLDAAHPVERARRHGRAGTVERVVVPRRRAVRGAARGQPRRRPGPTSAPPLDSRSIRRLPRPTSCCGSPRCRRRARAPRRTA